MVPCSGLIALLSTGAVIALHPLLRSALAAPVPHTRRALLSPEFDRLLQVHVCQPGVQPGSGCSRYALLWPDVLRLRTLQDPCVIGQENGLAQMNS